MNNLKDMILDPTTIDDIVYWVIETKEHLKDKRVASCQSLFPLINIIVNCV